MPQNLCHYVSKLELMIMEDLHQKRLDTITYNILLYGNFHAFLVRGLILIDSGMVVLTSIKI